MRLGGGLLLLGFSIGCASTVSGAPGSSDAAFVDAGAVDTAPVDAGTVDTAPVDAGTVDTAPIGANDIARACLLAVGCAAAPVGNLSACITGLTTRALAPSGTGEDLWDRLLECSAQPAATAICDAFVDCATRGHPAAYCAAHPGDSCDGAFAVHCGTAGAPATASDCFSIPGATCASPRSPRTDTYCSAGCSPTCAGNVAAVSCAGASDPRADRCTAGMTCIISPSFAGIYGDCLPPGPACTATGGRCEGSVLVQCRGVFETVLRETRSDCSRLGWQCVTGDAGAACVPPPSTCADDAPPTCDGDTLVACAPGATRFDCRALGFARCAPAAKAGAARCEP